MDEETASAILAFQLEDLESIVANRKGKAREDDPPTDDELAINLQIDELRRQQANLADARMARSIGSAVQNDEAAITILDSQERRSAQDHLIACQLSGQLAPVMPDTSHSQADENALSSLGLLNIFHAQDDGSIHSEPVTSFGGPETGESSAWAASRKNPEKEIQHECVACAETRVTIEVPCHHQYCKDCIVRLVTDALVDESLFPPRCCGQNMTMSLIRPYISTDLAAKMEQKTTEFGTPNRTYCAYCESFINLHNIDGNRGHCLGCDADTCILCKQRFHDGDCHEDPGLDNVLRMASEQGWQRCLGCQALVERREGCNHIV
ncbi:hypothetical protein MMC13_002407 [Lambiella insularis]|nr:hypothetical protein [Lambiella insularis]